MCRPDGRHVFFKGKVQMITYLPCSPAFCFILLVCGEMYVLGVSLKGVRIVKDIKIAYNNKCRNETYFIERKGGRH